MDIITSVKGWVGKLAELGVSLLALTIVAELLGLGAVPFMPEGVSVISNVTGVVMDLVHPVLSGCWQYGFFGPSGSDGDYFIIDIFQGGLFQSPFF